MTSRRAILLEALDEWRREGAIDEDAWRFLRSRYENAPAGELDAPLDGAAPEARLADAIEEERKGGFALDAMQFVGGLLLGAAAIALVIYLEVETDAVPWVLVGLGAAGVGAAAAVHLLLGEERSGLTEAALAGGLVPAAVSAGYAIAEADPLAGLVAVALAVVGQVLRGGRGPSTLVAAAAFSLGSAAVIVEDVTNEPGTARALAWLAALLGYTALALAFRRQRWSGVAVGAMVIPLVIAWIALLGLTFDGLESVTLELLVGAFLAALLAVGVWLGVRGLVAAAAAGLTIDAIVFAFDVGGPGTALVLLLALGGLLVWQAQFIRGYFRGHKKRL